MPAEGVMTSPCSTGLAATALMLVVAGLALLLLRLLETDLVDTLIPFFGKDPRARSPNHSSSRRSGTRPSHGYKYGFARSPGMATGMASGDARGVPRPCWWPCWTRADEISRGFEIGRA